MIDRLLGQGHDAAHRCLAADADREPVTPVSSSVQRVEGERMSNGKTNGGRLRQWWHEFNSKTVPYPTDPGRAAVPYPPSRRGQRHAFAKCEEYLLREIVHVGGWARHVNVRGALSFVAPWLIQPWRIHASLMTTQRAADPVGLRCRRWWTGLLVTERSGRSGTSSGTLAHSFIGRCSCPRDERPSVDPRGEKLPGGRRLKDA
ncbi:hypothetical protein ARTHRO9AX_220245 [Arthrobacter sp. 9AX]|nr:hypothetical protein ARTHRO9AX_220245 [Arthrobacter sp. 9AX]